MLMMSMLVLQGLSQKMMQWFANKVKVSCGKQTPSRKKHLYITVAATHINRSIIKLVYKT